MAVRVIAAGSTRLANWPEIWSYRELLAFLAMRDIKLRYRQTALGVSWALLQPIALMLVFVFVFGRLVGLADRTGGVPYPLFVLAGLVPWTFFATSAGASGSSLVGSAQLVTKVYFPRLIIPLATVAVGLLDLAVSLVLLLLVMWYYGSHPGWTLLLAPLPLLGIVMVTIGVGAILSALTVTYRDFKFVIPFLIQFWMFATPVIYPSSLLPTPWRVLQAINPVAGLLDAFRSCALGLPLDWNSLALSAAVGLLTLLVGTVYFRGVERRLADVI